jgi:hypothetical protein
MPVNQQKLHDRQCLPLPQPSSLPSFQPNDHEGYSITPENERYCAGGGRIRSIKFLEI